MKIPLYALLLTISAGAAAQNTDSLLHRAQAIRINGMDFLGVDGIEISYLTANSAFTPKALAKAYRQLKVKADDLVASDSLLGINNYYISRTFDRSGLTGYLDYYFIEQHDGTSAVAFQSKYKPSQEFEREIVNLCINRKIPADIYQPPNLNSFNFAGREILLGAPCQWMSVNNLQCPRNGQLSWSSFQEKEQGQKDLDDHFEFLKRSSKGQVISDEIVDVTFEDQDAKARKVVYDFKGATSVLVGMSGGKTLTIYMVAAQVRGRFVAAVMSHWNNDYVGRAGVPALTYRVMQLKGID
jgi:hypothetical protein